MYHKTQLEDLRNLTGFLVTIDARLQEFPREIKEAEAILEFHTLLGRMQGLLIATWTIWTRGKTEDPTTLVDDLAKLQIVHEIAKRWWGVQIDPI
jgi:hypothetical protein